MYYYILIRKCVNFCSVRTSLSQWRDTKTFLSKLFSKVELFSCLEVDFLREFNNQDTKNNTRNEEIVYIDDEDVKDNALLPFPSFCSTTEGTTTIEHKEKGDLRNLDKIFVNDGSNNNVS